MKVTRTTRTIEFNVEESSVTICRRRTVIERAGEPGEAKGRPVEANGHTGMIVAERDLDDAIELEPKNGYGASS